MSPPELAGDAPVAFLAEPVEVAFGVAVGGDFDAAVEDGGHGGLGEAGSAGAVGEGDAVVGRFTLSLRTSAGTPMPLFVMSPMRTNHWSER